MFCNEIWTKWYKRYANECQINRLTAMQIQVAVSLFGSDSQKTHLLQNFILIHHAFPLNTNSNDKSNIIHSM